MDTTKEQKLQASLAELHRRFGNNAVRQGMLRQNPTALPTGFPQLDALIGGIPLGRVTELVTSPTSGMTTVALKMMATVQKTGGSVVYFDLAVALDPEYAAYCGLDFDDLMFIRDEFETCADILYASVLTGIPDLIIFNTFPKMTAANEIMLAQTLSRLQPTLPNKKCALVLITLATPSPSRISAYATLRLRSHYDRWLGSERETYGYQAVITVLKGKATIEGRKAAIQIVFDDKMAEADP